MIRRGGFEFLGAPIGDSEFCNSHAGERVNKARKLLSAIGELPDPQIGLRLVRSCAGFCRLVYSARVVCPDAHQPALQEFDSIIKETISDLTGLSFSDRQWAQAGRSFKTAGLGLRSGSRHAACAYLSSRASTRDKCLQIDPNFVWDIDSPGSDASRAFQALAATLPPENQLTTDDSRLASQRTLVSKLVDEADFACQYASADAGERANLLSESLCGARVVFFQLFPRRPSVWPWLQTNSLKS